MLDAPYYLVLKGQQDIAHAKNLAVQPSGALYVYIESEEIPSLVLAPGEWSSAILVEEE